MSDLTPAQQRERAILLLQQAFTYPTGPVLVRRLQTKLKIKMFTTVPDEKCANVLAEAEKLLASVKNQPPPAASPAFNQATALTEFALAVDRVKQSVPDEAGQRRLDWAMQRALLNPWRLEGCRLDDIEHELKEIVADEGLFADFTFEELLASERKLARVIDFERATHADFINLLFEPRDYGLLVEECEALLYDCALQPILKRLLRALAGAPLAYRVAVAAICDPRGAGKLTSEDLAQIHATLRRREVPGLGADGGNSDSPPPHIQ
jgi:hypothetical protein